MPGFELTLLEQIAVWDRLLSRTPSPRPPHPQLLKRIAAPMGKQQALDLGCGAGRHFPALFELGYTVTGLDWSAEACLRARALLAGQQLGGQVVKGDFRRLPFAPGSFHVIIAVDTLHHLLLVDFKRVLGEIKRVLAIGGRAIFNVPTLRNKPVDFPGIWIEPNTLVLASGPEAGLPHRFFGIDELRMAAQRFRAATFEPAAEALPPDQAPLHAGHANEWWWVTLSG